MVISMAKARSRKGAARTRRVVLPVSEVDRTNQLAARAELHVICQAYLATPEDKRDPNIAEQIVIAALDYFDGEKKAGL
jgi:hypothetical protein